METLRSRGSTTVRTEISPPEVKQAIGPDVLAGARSGKTGQVAESVPWMGGDAAAHPSLRFAGEN
jgi:hypothetical protein